MPGFTPDSTCIVAALSAWHQDHEACATEIEQRLARGEPLRIAAPTLVESYSVLTRLPRPRRVSPIVALSLLRDTLMQRGSVIALDQGSYTDLLDRAVTQGTAGGPIYDAVVAACARLAGVRTLLTLNERHFRPFAGDGLMIEVPHSDHG